MSTSPGRLAFLLGALVAVLAATLYPASGGEPGDWIACILCADRAVADVLVNIGLFLPLGAGLAVQRWPIRRCILLAAGVSVAIEYAQLFVPNRDSSLADIASNIAGAAIGLALVRTAATWLVPPPHLAARLALGAATAAAVTFGVSGVLLVPSVPAAPFLVERTPNLPGLEWYRGRVLGVNVGDSGFSLHVRLVAGPPTAGLGPIVRIADAEGREVMLLGVDRRDVVLQPRMRAVAFKLDQPDLRLADGLQAVSLGDTVDISARGRGGRYCLSLDDRAACELGFRVARGWALLYYADAPSWLKTLLDMVWMAGLLFLPGFWARSGGGALVAAGICAAGLALTQLTVPVLPSSAGDWLAAGIGFVMGAGVRRAIVGRSARDGAGPR